MQKEFHMPYDACIQKKHLVYMNMLQKKIFITFIYNFSNMFLSHEVKDSLLDNTIYHFSSARFILNENYNPLHLKMKISIGLVSLVSFFSSKQLWVSHF